MNDQKNDQQQDQVQRLAAHVQQGLDEAADGLDMRVQSRLRCMRVQAVEAVEHPSVWRRMRQVNQSLFTNPVMQGAAFASVATLAVSLWLMPGYQAQNTTVYQENGVEVNEMDVLMSNEDMDFLENLEVYEWLEAEYG